MSSNSPTYQTLSAAQFSQLEQRLADAAQLGLSLDASDLTLLQNILASYYDLQVKIQSQDATLAKLRKMCGITPKSERSCTNKKDHSANKDRTEASPVAGVDDRSDAAANNEADAQGQSNTTDTDSGAGQPEAAAENNAANDDSATNSAPEADSSDNKQNRKSSYSAYGAGIPWAPNIVFEHEIGFQSGDDCPLCNLGRLYPYKDPFVFIRVCANKPATVEKHIFDRVRCNGCLEIFYAPWSVQFSQDGAMNQKYCYSMQAAMISDKFFSGTPYNHFSIKYALHGIPMPVSSVYEQVGNSAKVLEPLEQTIRRLAAQARLMAYDDTRHQIIEIEPEWRAARNGKGQRLRKGVYCSCVIGLDLGREYVVFDISMDHSGELIDAILKLRDSNVPMAKTMCDALSSNKPTEAETIASLCNVHGRRGFWDARISSPTQANQIIEWYKVIWRNDDATKEKRMTEEERCNYHFEHSLPVMQKIFSWCILHLDSDEYEQNSQLSKAAAYFIRHYLGLSLFCFVPGIPLDNNRTEQTLRCPIRGRDQYHFFRTLEGARVASIHLTILMTAIRAGVNHQEYLEHVLRHHQAVAADPDAWLPWNYKKTLSEMPPTDPDQDYQINPLAAAA